MPNPKPLIYQKGACVYEKENPTNPVNVTVVCVLHTDHISPRLRLPNLQLQPLNPKLPMPIPKNRMTVRGLDAKQTSSLEIRYKEIYCYRAS